MANAKEFIVQPDPKRMIEGLRDTGYEFNTAVADLIDNSISAEATLVDVRVELDYRDKVRLSIADDGHGMAQEELKDAMQYGAKKREDPASLGKYGLGLKTASTAFCRKLSVCSRCRGEDPLITATWDLDVVAEKNKWLLLISDNPDKEAAKHLNEVAANKAGTVVFWEKVDRLLKDYSNPGGAHARRALKKKAEALKKHIAMVYQRFLDHDDARAKNVSMFVNGEKIESWDPFVLGLSEKVAEETVEVQTATGKNASFSIKAYILPRREEFESADLAKRAELSSERQGIYIYRENRLIHDADWLGIYKKEPHSTLLRVEFSFGYQLDEAFELDIKKSQIILKDELWNWLADQFLPAPRREANSRYRKGRQKKIYEKSAGAHDNSNNNIRNRELAAGGAQVTVVDPNNNEVMVQNAYGKFKLIIPVGSANRPGEMFVQPVESIINGLLFEPALIDQHRAVKINTSHPYYHKVYVPNLSESVTLQGMDALMWALCVAELTTIRDETAEHFSDMRFEVSRILSKLVETLPDPESGEEDVA